ncbi:unnamed protein product, partial [Owenia fusiformis]
HAFDCRAKINDWTFEWGNPEYPHNGRTYAVPHPANPRCQNSYFVKRSWTGNTNFKSKCFLIKTYNVGYLKECKIKACHDKANAFNIHALQTDTIDIKEHSCETMHCSWNVAADDYNFKIVPTNTKHVHIYSLSHVTQPCNTVFWNESVMIPAGVPQCTGVVKFQNTLITNDQNPEFICRAGFNSLQTHESGNLAFKCESNDEGTGWKYYNIEKCFKPEKKTSLRHPAAGLHPS